MTPLISCFSLKPLNDSEKEVPEGFSAAVSGNKAELGVQRPRVQGAIMTTVIST